MLTIEVYTDGSSQNPGVGGYCAIMRCAGQEKIIRNHTTKRTTNNSMELQPMLATINWLNEYQKLPCHVKFFTDSNYIINCAKPKMKDGSEKKSDWFKDRSNGDLWLEFIKACHKGKHMVTFVKVKAHSGNAMNERCDKIAKEELVKARHKLYENT